MYIRQRDVLVGAVLVLYIVFFALSPPAAVRTILSNPIGVAASFGLAVYTALYYSKPIGALLIIALLASMTRSTEHMTDSERTTLQTELASVNSTISELRDLGVQPETNDALKNALARQEEIQKQLSSAPSTTSTSELDELNKTIAELQGMGLNPETNDALKNALARRDQLRGTSGPPITTPTAPALSSPAPAMPPPSTPPPPAAAPKPVMACNIENFAPF
jgi:TolA-binding protein